MKTSDLPRKHIFCKERSGSTTCSPLREAVGVVPQAREWLQCWKQKKERLTPEPLRIVCVCVCVCVYVCICVLKAKSQGEQKHFCVNILYIVNFYHCCVEYSSHIFEYSIVVMSLFPGQSSYYSTQFINVEAEGQRPFPQGHRSDPWQIQEIIPSHSKATLITCKAQYTL